MERRSGWYGKTRTPRPSPEEVVPLLMEWADAELVRELGIRYMDLPHSPAARVQGRMTTIGRLGLGRRTDEFIKYALFPAGTHDLCVVWVSWWDERNTDEVVRLTDEVVAGQT